jgi:8-oxo-dGTP pyrophosphatase MutT (NUDIX family)
MFQKHLQKNLRNLRIHIRNGFNSICKKSPQSADIMNSPQNPWTTHSSETHYDNPWIQVTEHQVTHPNGDPGIYGVVHMKNVATGIVPVDEEGCTWLVGQWRYPLNGYSWEIPEGGAPEGTPPLDGAKRELLEEVGLEAVQWTFLQQAHLSNSVTDEIAMIYLAQGIRKVSDPTPEASEDLTLRRLPLSEALGMIHAGEITDAVSIIGLLQAWDFTTETQR